MSAARLAAHVNVGQEVHFDGLHARTAALLAAAALDVERETSCFETANLCVGRRFEQFPDIAEHVGIGRRIAARRTADRRLVDHHQLVDICDSFDRIVFERLIIGMVQVTVKRRAQRRIDQRRLAATAYTRHTDHHPEREIDRNVLQVVAARTANRQHLPVAGSPHGRQFDLTTAAQVIGRDTAGMHHPVERTRSDDLSAANTGFRTDINDPVRIADHLLVVLNHNDRVPRIA